MKTYQVLYAEDVPHYAQGEVKARTPQAAIRKARRMDTDSFWQYEPDWERAFCKRIVHIEAADGKVIAEDIQLDEDTAFALVGHPDKIRTARAANELLDALERACALIDRIRDTCEYEGGLPVTFLEARAIEIIHGDAVTELPAIRELLTKLRRKP